MRNEISSGIVVLLDVIWKAVGLLLSVATKFLDEESEWLLP